MILAPSNEIVLHRVLCPLFQNAVDSIYIYEQLRAHIGGNSVLDLVARTEYQTVTSASTLAIGAQSLYYRVCLDEKFNVQFSNVLSNFAHVKY